MVIYWGICVLTMAITWAMTSIREGKQFIKKHKWISAILCASPLIFLSSLRYGIGSDYFSYVEIYHLIGISMNNAHIYEPVLSYMIMGMNRLGLDSQWFFVVTSVVFLALIFKTILQYSQSPELSVFLLLGMTFFFQSTNIVRQMVACAICFYSLQYIERRKLVHFVVCIFLASGFHTSAIIFLPAFFLYRKRFNLRVYAGSITVFFAVSTLLASYLRSFVAWLGEGLNNGYYLTYLRYGGDSFGWVSFLINVAVFIWSYFFLNKEDKSKEILALHNRGTSDGIFNDMLLNLQFVTVILSILNGSFPLVNRIRFYYALPGLLLIPRTLCSRKLDKVGRIVTGFLIVLLFFLYCLYIEGYMNQSAAIPYVSIFNH